MGSTPYIARGIVRTGPGTDDIPFGWRRGPDTTDGYWAVTLGRKTTSGEAASWAVRVIVAPAARDCGSFDLYRQLENALHVDAHEAEDSYLAAIDVVRAIPPDELSRLRDAVRAGKTGGASDGAPVRRTRKAAAS